MADQHTKPRTPHSLSYMVKEKEALTQQFQLILGTLPTSKDAQKPENPTPESLEQESNFKSVLLVLQAAAGEDIKKAEVPLEIQNLFDVNRMSLALNMFTVMAWKSGMPSDYLPEDSILNIVKSLFLERLRKEEITVPTNPTALAPFHKHWMTVNEPDYQKALKKAGITKASPEFMIRATMTAIQMLFEEVPYFYADSADVVSHAKTILRENAKKNLGSLLKKAQEEKDFWLPDAPFEENSPLDQLEKEMQGDVAFGLWMTSLRLKYFPNSIFF